MQSDPRKETSKSAVAARARMLHAAHLSWLEGFPLAAADGGVRWLAVPVQAPARETVVEGRHLSQATYALNQLRGEELAPALPRFAGEPAVWLDSIERRIALLKRTIHHGDPLPQQPFAELPLSRARRAQALRLAAAEPRLLPLLSAVCWVHAGHAERLGADFDLLPGWSRGFEVLTARLGEQPALVTLLRLLQLAASHGANRVQALASALFDERTHDAALQEGHGFCSQILVGIGKRPKAPLPDKLPAGDLGRELALWCEELVVQENRRSRQQALRLFELARPQALVEQWALWWETARRLLRKAHVLRAQAYDRESRRQLREEVERHQQSAPPELAAADLLTALRQSMEPPGSALTNQLLRALALVPSEADDPGRLHLFLYWSFFCLTQYVPAAPAMTLLAGFVRYLSRRPAPDAALLRPWSSLSLTRWRHTNTVESELARRPRGTMLAAYDHLASVAARHGGLEREDAVKAVELFVLAGDSDLAARLFESLRAGDRLHAYQSHSSVLLALRLCRERPERYADVLKALAVQEDQGNNLPPHAWPEPVLGPLSSGEVGELVRESIVSRQLTRLLACGTKSVLLAAAETGPLPLPQLGEPAAPDWVERYPPRLRPALCRLAAVLDDSEIKVARWLGDDLPEAPRLEREISAIELRLPQADEARQGALRTRLDNLRARLARPAAPSPARLERLRARLDRAWGRAVLDRWERDLDALLPAALRRLLDVEEIPDWLTEPRPLSLLAAATRLRSGPRRLAYRLFRLRCGPPPWDLRDAPQNRAFVESHPHVDWEPWIEGLGTVSVTAATGRVLSLRLEDDPLEIFRMGEHFQTCLSPGSANYFSVFANAADVNKRVLYARDNDGRVVGRCLLALTAQAEMLTFEAYCHDGNLGFDQIRTDFAEQLAARMRTRRVASGKVPVLVATDWYDDGPHDVGHRFACLEEGSPLRQRLATLRPGELLDELARALKPARLDETTLPLILELPELAQRPELVAPLLRPLSECRALPEEPLVTAAWLALQGGSADLIRRHLLHPLLRWLRLGFRSPRTWIDPRAIEVLVRLDPARLLAVLRQTRTRSEPDWLDETDGLRLESAAAALAALHRPRQAQALWRRLATSSEVDANEEQRGRARGALGV